MPSTEPLIFTDANASRVALEALRWPNGPACPHCGSARVTRIVGKKQTHRAGLFTCKTCRSQFTVTVGTSFERSKVPLHKWLQVLRCENSKEGMTSWEMARATGLTYKTIEKMRTRIYAAVDTYDGPNTIFGRNITAYIRDRRPKPPVPSLRPKFAKALLVHGDDADIPRGRAALDFRGWYKWREKHPLGGVIPADGSLAALCAPLKGIDRTERLARLLLRTPKPPQRRKRTVRSRKAV